jgi:ATP-dependent helicase HepA
MSETMDGEVARLEDLREVNPIIDDSEINAVREREEELKKAITGSRVRLDSLRLIYKAPGK